MRALHKILTLAAAGRPHREIATACGIGVGTVSKYRVLALTHGVLPPPPEMSDEALATLFFPPRVVAVAEGHDAVGAPDWPRVEQELKRPGVTRHLLWEEAQRAGTIGGLQYSQFCARYEQWRDTLDVCLRQEHRAGDKAFTDYSGTLVPITDPTTGTVREAQLFVGVLGASNLVFTDVTWTQTLPDWVMSHVRMFTYYGAVPACVVHDNLRSGTTTPDRYDPITNATYLEMLEFYGTASLPTRIRKPRDKAKVENEVLHVLRAVQAPLRDRVFYSLPEAQDAYAAERELLNERPFQKLPGHRWERYETIERAHMRPLPAESYVYATWKESVQVGRDCYVQVDKHYYSVPYRHRRARCRVRLTEMTVTIYLDRQCVATHLRGAAHYQHTTIPAHLPPAHRRYQDTTPAVMIDRGKQLGPYVAQFIVELYAQRTYPEQTYRRVQGLFRLAAKYPPEQVDRVCRRAIEQGCASYRTVKTLLAQHATEGGPAGSASRDPEADAAPAAGACVPDTHAHIRGRTDFR